MEDWPQHLPPEFYAGLAQLNQGEYYACHETLEALWLAETGRIRQVYQGVLQIAVGCFHLTERLNWIGAVRKLDEGARRLERMGLSRSMAYGVDWAGLIGGADALHAHLRTLGPDKVADYDPALLPKCVYLTG